MFAGPVALRVGSVKRLPINASLLLLEHLMKLEGKLLLIYQIRCCKSLLVLKSLVSSYPAHVLSLLDQKD